MGWRDKVAKRYNELILEDAPPMGYMNGNTTDGPLSLKELNAAEKGFGKLVGLPSPDILVMTEEKWKLLREHTQPGITPLRQDSPPDLLGIPVEVYPTQEECKARAFILLGEGKRVGLVEDNPNE